MRKPTVLFDMDGVLCDFVGGSLRRHGLTLPLKECRWDFMEQVGFVGGGDPRFWEPLSNPEFWANLDPMPDGMELFSRVVEELPRDQVGFLSSGLCPGSADGKRDWIRRHLPGWEKHLILGTAKHLVAAPCKVLIDDFDHNIDGWHAAGCSAVYAPRPWNKRSQATDDRGLFDVGHVHGTLRAVLCKIAPS